MVDVPDHRMVSPPVRDCVTIIHTPQENPGDQSHRASLAAPQAEPAAEKPAQEDRVDGDAGGLKKFFIKGVK